MTKYLILAIISVFLVAVILVIFLNHDSKVVVRQKSLNKQKLNQKREELKTKVSYTDIEDFVVDAAEALNLSLAYKDVYFMNNFFTLRIRDRIQSKISQTSFTGEVTGLNFREDTFELIAKKGIKYKVKQSVTFEELKINKRLCIIVSRPYTCYWYIMRHNETFCVVEMDKTELAN